jgi:hypothetical protein
VHHDVVDLRARADAAEGEPVDLVVGRELHAAELDAHVTHLPARVVGLVPTIGGVGARGDALDVPLAAGQVDRRLAEEDDAAPVPRGALAHGRFAGEDDGVHRRPLGHDLGARLDHQRPQAHLVPVNLGALVDLQGRRRLDVDEALEVVTLVRAKRGVLGDVPGQLGLSAARGEHDLDTATLAAGPARAGGAGRRAARARGAGRARRGRGRAPVAACAACPSLAVFTATQALEREERKQRHRPTAQRRSIRLHDASDVRAISSIPVCSGCSDRND